MKGKKKKTPPSRHLIVFQNAPTDFHTTPEPTLPLPITQHKSAPCFHTTTLKLQNQCHPPLSISHQCRARVCPALRHPAAAKRSPGVGGHHRAPATSSDQRRRGAGRGGAEWPRLRRGGVDFFFFFRELTLMRRGVKGPLSAGGALFARRCSGTARPHRYAPDAPRRGRSRRAPGGNRGPGQPPPLPGFASSGPGNCGRAEAECGTAPSPRGDSRRLSPAAPPGPAALSVRSRRGPAAGRASPAPPHFWDFLGLKWTSVGSATNPRAPRPACCPPAPTFSAARSGSGCSPGPPGAREGRRAPSGAPSRRLARAAEPRRAALRGPAAGPRRPGGGGGGGRAHGGPREAAAARPASPGAQSGPRPRAPRAPPGEPRLPLLAAGRRRGVPGRPAPPRPRCPPRRPG